MLRIPEGWFLMGSDANQPGQDNERPVHRVWIDAFEFAACQVTNADYAKFLAGHQPSQAAPLGRSKFLSPRATGRRAIVVRRGGVLRMAERAHAQALPPAHRSRMGTRRARRRRAETLPLGRRPTRIARKLRVALEDARPSASATPRKTPTASSTSAQTSTNGAPTGSTPITTASRPIATHRAPPKENANPRAAAPGAIRQKYRAAPPAPASPQNFNTQITASVSPAI